MDYIYELADTSDDERYFRAGMFLSEEEARAAIDEAEKEGTALTVAGLDGDTDWEEVTLWKIPRGLCGDLYKTVLTLKREYQYDEDTDTYSWRQV